MSIKEFKISRFLPLTLVLLGAILSIACENDAKDIDRLANIKAEEAVDISKDVTVVYSDSAQVKAELKAPEMRVYHDSTGSYEFKKGVQIIFFDEFAKEMQRITSKYAIQRTESGITEFRNDVVITKVDGTVIKTEELIYDENQKKYYGSQPITAEYNDGRTSAQGTSFTSDANFNDIRFTNGTAIHFPTTDSQLPGFGN